MSLFEPPPKTFDLLHEAMIITDAEIDEPGPRILYANQAFLTMTGYSRAELLGKSPRLLQGPRTDRATLDRLRRCLETGTTFRGETFNYRRDGSPFLMRWYVEPIRDADGTIIRYFAVQRDVTPEIEQRNQRRALSYAVGQLSDSVLMFRPNGVVTYANRAFVHWSRWSEEQIIGTQLWKLPGFPQRRSELRWARRILQMGRSWHRDFAYHRRADNQQFFLSVGVTPIRDKDGTVLDYVAVGRDITEHRRLESIAEANNFHDNIGVVFAGIRHELGNPVNSVKTALRVVTDNLDTMSQDKQRSYLERMSGEISRIEFLLRSLRSYNLYDRPRLERLDLSTFLLRFLQLARLDLERQGVMISFSIDPDIDTAFADPQALHQVLLNLIGNASHALEDHDDAKIELSADRQGSYVSLLIRDNGPGIPAEHLPHVFKPFYTTRSGGTGLGLAISRHLLSLMRGTIEIDSSPSGTEVRIMLDRDEPRSDLATPP